jgi:PEP-CTERM motif
VTRKTLTSLLFLFFLSATPILADSVQFTGKAAFVGPGLSYSMSPYSGLLNGQAEDMFCVDYLTAVSSTSGWTATPTLLTNSSSSYQNTLQFQLTGSSAIALNNYLEMAWLITQLQNALSAGDLNTAAQDQWAIWSFSKGPDPYGTNSTLLGQAQLAVQGGFTVSGWEILTPDAGQVGQEVIVVSTPEPGTLVLLLAGAAASFAFGRLRKLALQ